MSKTIFSWGCCESPTDEQKREKAYKVELLEQEKEPTGTKQNLPEWKEELPEQKSQKEKNNQPETVKHFLSTPLA